MTKDRFRTDFVYIFQSLGQHRFVISQLAKRAVYGRYRGTVLGVLWSLLTPLLMLGLYTFVFGSVLKIRWPDQGGGQSEFAAILFSGMLIHSMFAECLNRASTVVVSNPQYVKKIVFPLEALSWVNLFSALFQALISTAILVSYLLIVKGAVPWTVVFFPLAFLALALFCIGVGWLISSAAVYVKDIAQVMGLVSTVLFFMAPILYPKSALPEQIQPILYLNPITFVVEQFRAVVLWGQSPNWQGLAIYAFVGTIFAWISLLFFQKTRSGFADVL